MEGGLGEDKALTGSEGALDETGAVFEKEADLEGASGQHVEELGGARVVVRRGQAARTVYVKGD